MNILIFGDSIARGAFDEKGGWVSRLKGYYLSGGISNFKHGIYNFSIPGITSRELLFGFDHTMQWFRLKNVGETVVVINVGTNDITGTGSDTPSISKQEYEENMLKVIKQAKKVYQKVILLGNIQLNESFTIPWVTGDFWSANENQKKYNSILKDIAIKQGCKYVDSREWIDPETDLDDGVHPNTIGHEKIFIKMKEVLDDLI